MVRGGMGWFLLGFVFLKTWSVMPLGRMGLIVFLFLPGDKMLQQAEVYIVLMCRTKGREGGGKMTAVAATTAMAWHFRAVLSGEIK
jgi:hypothetical protein